MQMIERPTIGQCHSAVRSAYEAGIGKPAPARRDAYLKAWSRRFLREAKMFGGHKRPASESLMALTGRAVGMLAQ